MQPRLERACLLLDQGRHELAAAEARQALGIDPHDAGAHAVLALCLAKREQFADATQEAQQAVQLAPDWSFAHYALALVLLDRECENEAEAAIQEALRLDPTDASAWAVLAQVRANLKQWKDALAAADQGLEHDPEHVACTNLRAMALVKLGRRAEAGASITAALARDPDDSTTHANQGWTLLESQDPSRALEHFREALRLDPENEWARQGIIEALKARYLIYSLFLRYFFWMSKLSTQAQWGVVIGGYVLNRMLSQLAKKQPEYQPYVLPFTILYLAFVLLTWLADPLFNLVLRLNRFGRLALSEEQVKASNWVGGCLFLALVCFGLAAALNFNNSLLVASLVLGASVIPLAAVFKCRPGWPRQAMAAYTGLMAFAGLLWVAIVVAAQSQPLEVARQWRRGAAPLLVICLGGAMLSSWVANFLLTRRPKR